METCGSRIVGCCSSFLRGLTAAFVVICVATLVFPEVATQLTCDPQFKQGVEECLSPLQGFPVMTRSKVLLPGDWNKTDAICKWLLVPTSSLCVRMKLASCPKAKAYSSLCGFQGLDSDLLLQFGETVCKHKEVFKQHSACMNGSKCSLESCLKEYDPILPTDLTMGLWQTPLYVPQCRYYAFAEHCYKESLFNNCHSDLYVAHMDILNLTRPAYCSEAEIARLRETFANGSASSRDRNILSVMSALLSSVICATLFVTL